MNKSVQIVILAAGKGKRLHSEKPKVLQKIANKPLLAHLLNTVFTITKNNINIVIGYKSEEIIASMKNYKVNWIYQKKQLGTAHAVMQAIPHLKENIPVVILYGDVPLISCKTLIKLIDIKEKNYLNLLTLKLDNPTSYGRIIRDEKNIIRKIIEEKDASKEQRKIKEVNSGIISVSSNILKKILKDINNNNKQNEYYLTDIVEKANNYGLTVNNVLCEDITELTGVNNLYQLNLLERIYQKKQAEKLLIQGLYIYDINRFDLRGQIEFGKYCSIDINCLLQNKIKLGKNTTIGANCNLNNVIIGDNVIIKDNTIIENTIIGNNCNIGPFARIRPETNIGDNCNIGNFVEVKKSNIGNNTKANHLTYLGDTTIGSDVNIGCGVVTCNYDGKKKHQTTIKNNAFIGSSSQLIAPVTIGKNSLIAAGSTITKNTPEDKITISRCQQKSIEKKKNKYHHNKI